MDTHIAFEGIIQGAGIPYAIVLYHVKGNDDREKIEYDKNIGDCSCASSPQYLLLTQKKEPAHRQVLFRMMMYAHTKS